MDPDLRATIDEALAVKRNKLAGSWYVFGNLGGQRYTKGGWKATLSKLMVECVAEAERRKDTFLPFSLQDCRPKGVSDKLARGDADTIDATVHSSERMIRQVYDRRRTRVELLHQIASSPCALSEADVRLRRSEQSGVRVGDLWSSGLIFQTSPLVFQSRRTKPSSRYSGLTCVRSDRAGEPRFAGCLPEASRKYRCCWHRTRAC